MNTTTTTEMIRDSGDYAEMLFIIYQRGGWIELGAGFVSGYAFATVAEAQAWCVETAKLMTPDVTLQPAKEHNGRPVGVAVRGSRVPTVYPAAPARRSRKAVRA